LAAWADAQASAELLKLAEMAAPYVVLDLANPAFSILQSLSDSLRGRLMTQVFIASLTQRPLQPIGLLHLERLQMTPLDVERGELAYSLPLAPNEKVTLAHREWAVREEQFSEFIEDQLVNFSEQGVAQTNDIAMSSTTQSDHMNALSVNQPVGGATAVHVTGAVDTTSGPGSSVDDKTSKEESKSASRTVTAVASTRTMKDHKISFTVTTVAGMEDFTAHLIENKHADKSMRIDYFKRVRNWRSDLYRYGVRLTYDVVLPDPGARLRDRVRELQQISQELSAEFQLGLVPSDVQVSNWESLADRYGVALPAPPEQVQQLESTQPIVFATPYDVNSAPDGSKWIVAQRSTPVTISTPRDYELSNLNIFGEVWCWPNVGARWLSAFAGRSWTGVNADAGGYCILDWNLGPGEIPAEGLITVVFRMRGAENGTLRLTATAVPTEKSMDQWRMTCWSIIRDAAGAAAALHRSYLRDRQAVLQKDVNNDDPVRLRRMERESVMRAVLEWMFPGFENSSSVLAGLPSPGSLAPSSWQQVMQYGEYIKFVQEAIDWDNLMVFLFPYFWDTVWHEPEKLLLEHPDAIHREFLRAGAARVILAIQPGFEDAVVSLLDAGQLGALDPKGRFAKAIKDVQRANAAYDLTAQQGKPVEDPEQPGILIGTWTDFTPSSAVDIEVTIQPVLAS
jgi:hypothetical protein